MSNPLSLPFQTEWCDGACVHGSANRDGAVDEKNVAFTWKLSQNFASWNSLGDFPGP